MAKWRIRTVEERNHGEPLRLSCWVDAAAYRELQRAVFVCDSMSVDADKRDVRGFSFYASKGALSLAMEGMQWSSAAIRAYRDAERIAEEETNRRKAA